VWSEGGLDLEINSDNSEDEHSDWGLVCDPSLSEREEVEEEREREREKKKN